MKKLLSLLLACAILGGCSHNGASAEVTTTGNNETIDSYDIRSYDYSSYSDKIEYNSNPDTSFKPLPGAYSLSDTYTPTSSKDLMKGAYGAVVVHINSQLEPLIIEFNGYEPVKGEDGFVETIIRNEIPVYEAEVLKSLGGGHKEGDIIKISTYLETFGIKFDEGKDYIVITFESADEDGKDVYYPPNHMIHSIFEIKEDYTVVAQSPLYVCAKYDGLPLADVAHDFKEAFEELTK